MSYAEVAGSGPQQSAAEVSKIVQLSKVIRFDKHTEVGFD